MTRPPTDFTDPESYVAQLPAVEAARERVEAATEARTAAHAAVVPFTSDDDAEQHRRDAAHARATAAFHRLQEAEQAFYASIAEARAHWFDAQARAQDERASAF